MSQDRLTPSAEVFRALVTSLEAALAADPTWIEQAKAALLAAAPAAPAEGGVEPSSTGGVAPAAPEQPEWPWHPGLMCLCPECRIGTSGSGGKEGSA